jgi:hypothetical protein
LILLTSYYDYYDIITVQFLGFPVYNKKLKYLDSGKIRSSSWSAKVFPGLAYSLSEAKVMPFAILQGQ